MSEIKNFHLLTDLSEVEKTKLEAGALLHRRHINLTFKVKEYSDNEAVIVATQGKNFANKYLTAKEITSSTKATFEPFLKSRSVVINPITFTGEHSTQ